MTATLLPTRPETTAAAPARARAFGDRHAALLLGLLFALVVAVTWRKGGAPEADAGSELATADLVGHGTVPYEGVRYYYGPLGLYGLVLAFKLTGASFGTAFGFGLLQAAGIVGALYALARQVPITAAAAAATATTSYSGRVSPTRPTKTPVRSSRPRASASSARRMQRIPTVAELVCGST